MIVFVVMASHRGGESVEKVFFSEGEAWEYAQEKQAKNGYYSLAQFDGKISYTVSKFELKGK